MDGGKTYQSTKFTLLDDAERCQSWKKKRLLFIIVVTLSVLIVVPSAYYHYHLYSSSQYQKENRASSAISHDFSATHNPEDSLIYIFPKKIWISPENQREVGKHPSKLLCGKTQELIPGIPLSTVVPKGNPTTISDFINADLLLHYERIINKHDSRRLRLIFEDYHKKLSRVNKPESFLNFLNYLKLDKLKFYAGYFDLKLELNDFKYIFDLTNEIRLWYVYLDGLRGFLLNYEQQKNRKSYSAVITEKNFGRFTKETQERFFRFHSTFNITEKKLKEINEVITEWTSPANIIINDNSLILHSKVLLTSQIKTLNTSSVKSLYAFATHTIYLDEDLALPGVNVAVVAPRWVFLKKVKINLSGRAGERHENETAEDGKVGKPGNPGENSGDFIGVGDVNWKFLTAIADGGRGGEGQNGAPGGHGADYTSPGRPVKKPSCVFKIYTFNNSLGQVLTHYKIYNETGCGGPGLDGGVGGEGGKGGNVILVNKQSGPNVTRGLDGMRGLSGKGGKGGLGGRNGCFYEVLDVDDKILHWVTTVKCPLGNTLPSGNAGMDNRNADAQLHPPEKVNLSVSDSVFSFFQFAGDDFARFSGSVITEFLDQINLDVLFYNVTDFHRVFDKFEIFQKLDKFKFYQVLENKIHSRLREREKDQPVYGYLRTLMLGKMLILKRNVNYMFIDFDDYLNTIQRNIESVNEDTVGRYFPSVLNTKIGYKLEEIGQSLVAIKSKLALFNEGNEKLINKLFVGISNEDAIRDYEVLARALKTRRLLSPALTVVELMIRFVNLVRDLSRSKEKLEFKNLLMREVFSHDDRLRRKEEFFDRISHLSSSQKRILSRIAASAGEYEEHSEIFTKVTDLIESLPREDETLVRILENFDTRKWEAESEELVEKVKEVVDSLSAESEVLAVEGKILLRDLTDEVDHLMAVYYLAERRELEKSFLNSLNDWKFNGEEGEIKFFRSRLWEVFIILEYNLAVDAAQAKLYPSRGLSRDLRSRRNLADEALAQINHLRKIGSQIPICTDVQEAVFDKHSAVGEFYFWRNSGIKSKLKELFGGAEVRLKSDLSNRHILDKNFLRFKSLKMDFESSDSSFHRFLEDFRLEMTHSGYSYYNWRGETQIRVSEEVTFNYGFKSRGDGEPEIYSALFKKFRAGDIALSPYTTWTLRLLPLNEAADYDKLIHFSDVVDIRLVGTGTFIS